MINNKLVMQVRGYYTRSSGLINGQSFNERDDVRAIQHAMALLPREASNGDIIKEATSQLVFHTQCMLAKLQQN